MMASGVKAKQDRRPNIANATTCFRRLAALRPAAGRSTFLAGASPVGLAPVTVPRNSGGLTLPRLPSQEDVRDRVYYQGDEKEGGPNGEKSVIVRRAPRALGHFGGHRRGHGPD